MIRDIIQNDNGDIKFLNGDILLGDSTRQHMRDLLLTNRGELKHSPLTGVGLNNYLNDETPEDMMRDIRKQVIKDGAALKSIVWTGDQLKLDVEYED